MPRMKTYLGPKVQIQPDALHKYESAGLYVAEEKHDGHWAEIVTDAEGRIKTLTSRSGTRFEGINVEGLIGHPIYAPNSVLVGELEAATEAANKRNAQLGHRRLWVFDVVQMLGQDVTGMTYEQRRELLNLLFAKVLSDDKRVLLVRQASKGFADFFKDVMNEDGEGLVLKRLGRPYKPYGSDGKTDDWIRCKRFRFVDYVVMSIGKSDGGSPNFQVGLYNNGKLERVATIKNIPNGLDYNALVGKVIECKGAEVHDSGALRHGHYERTRWDKEPEECTLQAALEA